MGYKAKDGFTLPEGETRIWRYMDIAKFIRILDTKSLYFSTKKQLDDAFEGCLPAPSLKELCDYAGISDPEHIKNIIPTLANSAISCWHMNEYEDYLMWSRYASTQGIGGVAIQSTVDKLCKAFKKSKTEVNIGKVEYIDYEKDSLEQKNLGNFEQFLLHKRKQFRAEQEIRAMAKIPRGHEHGLEVPCDLVTLIESVYVAPSSPGYVRNVVESVCKKFKLRVKSQSSSLSALPPHLRVLG